tara:strand:- start:2933 stop:3823 length:891 start_codon:yes stop_codon:yes gene_type:complete
MANKEITSNPNDAQQKVEDAVFGSGDDYFDALDKEVNGVIRDPGQEKPEEQTTQETVNEQVPDSEPKVNQDNSTDWKKRYSDSSSEAQRLSMENRELAPLKPLLNVMKRDSGLVDTIRNYLNTGGSAPKSIQDELSLDEDFVYDGHEAVTKPDSKSAKVFNTMVDKAVNHKVSEVLQREKQSAQQQSALSQKRIEAENFMKAHNMSETDFQEMMAKAKKTKFSLDDMYYVLNRDKVKQNVAKSTKEDMLSQMKTMRDIPTSQANTNSAPKGDSSPDDKVFDAILGLDGEFDELFGG